MSKTIAITGAGKGLGRELAKRMIAEGYRVFLLGRTKTTLEHVAVELGDRAIAIECNVGDPVSVQSAFGTIKKRVGTLDVLINNAAVYENFMLLEASETQINETLLTDLHGPIWCTRAALPLMQRNGRVFNISSESVTGRHAMLSLYQSSKAGLERFTKAMQDELRDQGILFTLVRAGQMYSDDITVPSDTQERRQIMAENARRGVHPRERGVSHTRHVADVFRYIIQLPSDLTIPEVTLESVPMARAR